MKTIIRLSAFALLFGLSLPLSAQTVISGTKPFEAAATDPVVAGQSTSGVAYVQWEIDGGDAGAHLVTAPYHFDWNTTTLPDGIHRISVRAADNAGNIGRAGPLTYVVSNVLPDVTPPSVTIISPVAGLITGRVNVQASASDNVGVRSMELYIRGQRRASSTTGALLYSWNTAPDKKYSPVSMVVRAADTSGNVSSVAKVETIR